MEAGKRSGSGSNLPPGFRFHPTDEELIVHYLKNQAMSRPCPVAIIPEVDLYKFDPWELPEKAEFGENEWYFFSPRDRKYPNGVRPNRATRSGYWKATGTDKAIYSGSKYVGIKKALVFYQGRPPKGNKSNWIMHEYRLSDSRTAPAKQRGSSMRLDDWVLCRIYKKKHVGRTQDMKDEDDDVSQGVQSPTMNIASPNGRGATTTFQDHQEDQDQDQDQDQDHQGQGQVLKFPRTVSLTHLLDMDYLAPISHLLNESNPFNSAFEFQANNFGNGGFDANGTEKLQLGDGSSYMQFGTLSQSNGFYANPLSKFT